MDNTSVLRLTLSEWLERGCAVAGVLPTLTRVEPTDRAPWIAVGAATWLMGDPTYLPSILPAQLFSHLSGGELVRGAADIRVYASDREAGDDLSAACLAWARKPAAIETLGELGVKIKQSEVLAAAGYSKPATLDAKSQPVPGSVPLPDGFLQALDIAGLGATVWRYPAGNEKALEEAKRLALEQCDRVNIFSEFYVPPAQVLAPGLMAWYYRGGNAASLAEMRKAAEDMPEDWTNIFIPVDV